MMGSGAQWGLAQGSRQSMVGDGVQSEAEQWEGAWRNGGEGKWTWNLVV